MYLKHSCFAIFVHLCFFKYVEALALNKPLLSLSRSSSSPRRANAAIKTFVSTGRSSGFSSNIFDQSNNRSNNTDTNGIGSSKKLGIIDENDLKKSGVVLSDEDLLLRSCAPPVLHLDDLKDVPAPDPYWTWYRPFALVFVCAVGTVFYGLLLGLVAPLFAIPSVVRSHQVRASRYHTDPGDVRIAIIGGGWGGLQIADRLQELGATQITGFERWDDVGGTWHPKAAYFNQANHAPMWCTSFADFPHEESNGKLLANKIQHYNRNFTESKNLRRFFRFNADVRGIHYDTKSNKATLDVRYNSNDNIEQEGPFDMVIFASLNCEPNVPKFDGQDVFEGKILHSQDFKEHVFKDIFNQKQKVAVIGGGKTSIDLLLPFLKAGYSKSISWIYRRPYLFTKMEHALGESKDGPPSLAKTFLGLSNILTILLSPISTQLSRWIMWCAGFVWTYDNDGGNAPYVYKSAQVDKEQRTVMEGFDPNKRFRSGIERFESNGIRLQDGRFVEADVVLLATSMTNGFNKLQLTKDGERYVVDPEEPLLNGFALQSFPVLGCHSAGFYVGPQRARIVGDLALYHLCVLENPVSIDEGHQIARLQFGALFYAKVLLSGNFFFAKSGGLLDIQTQGLVSHVLSGTINFYVGLAALFKVYVLGRQDPLDLTILPPSSSRIADTAKLHNDA